MAQFRRKLQMLVNYSQNESLAHTLASYFLYTYQGNKNIPIQQVVEDTLISKSSILKFCKRLGFDTWRAFSAELQNTYLDEIIRLDSIKMDVGITNSYPQMLEKRKQEYVRIWESFQQTVTEDIILLCVKQIEQANRIIILGNLLEIPLFLELQRALMPSHKQIEFPNSGDAIESKKQLATVDSHTLIIYVDSNYNWTRILERETLTGDYEIADLQRKGAVILHIGQADYQSNRENVLQIPLPFSFDKNIIKSMLFECIQRIEYAYLSRH